MDESHLLALKRYNDARSRLRRLERELSEILAITQRATTTAQSLLIEARSAGLLAPAASAEDVDGVVALLREAAQPRPLDITSIDDPVTDLYALEDRRRRLRDDLQETREEIAEIERIQREASEFETEAREQEARLASIGLIGDGRASSDVCPVCASRLETPVPSVAEIRESLAGIELQLASVHRDSPRLQEHVASLESRRSELEEEIRTVQRLVVARIQENERLRIQQNQFAEQARVAGRIAYYLENVTAGADDSRLRQSIDALKAEIAELEQMLDEDALESRLETALNLVNRDLTDFAVKLGLEHGEHPLRLDRKYLTVIADTDDGPLALAQMGSGENWVGYHVAAQLSLHSLFRRRRRPVPAFLMLDQPSQAHYPPEQDEEGSVDALTDEDQQAVRRLFALLSEYCQSLQPNMQVIVADHVELLEGWFRDAMVERWRDGIKLVPQIGCDHNQASAYSGKAAEATGAGRWQVATAAESLRRSPI